MPPAYVDPRNEPKNIRLRGPEWEPPGLASASAADRKWYWAELARIALEVKRQEIKAGIGSNGRKLVKVKPQSRPDGAKGAPLDPHDEDSRTYRLLASHVQVDGVTLYWRGYGGGKSWATILGYHAYKHGPRRLPVRNTIGISPAGRTKIRTRAFVAWAKHGKSIVPEAKPKPKRMPSPPPPPKPPAVVRLTKGKPSVPLITPAEVLKLKPGTIKAVAIEIGGPRRKKAAPTLPPAPAPRRSPPAPRPKAAPPEPKKAPDPLAPFKAWRPHASEADAVAFLKQHHAVGDVVFTKAGGGLFPFDAEDKEFPTASARLEHLNRVIGEWNRITLAFPKLPKGSVKVFLALDGHRGRASVPARGNHYGWLEAKGHEWPNRAWVDTAIWEMQTGMKSSSERRGTQVQDNWRHELGHTLTTAQLYADFQAAAVASPRTATLDEIKKSVTDYAGGNWREAIAETFGIYTRANYRAGDLPANLEAFWRSFLGA